MSDTELYIVRHGEAVVNLYGSTDGVCHGLTDRGRRQAHCVGRHLADRAEAGQGFAAVYASTRLRCQQTADIIGEYLNLEVHAADELRSADFGDDGIDPWDVSKNLIGTIPPLAPLERATPTSEPWQDYLDRSGSALLKIVESHPDQRVLVVGHTETTTAAVNCFFRLPRGASRWGYTSLRHAAITVWRHERIRADELAEPAWQWCLAEHNNYQHLSGMQDR